MKLYFKFYTTLFFGFLAWLLVGTLVGLSLGAFVVWDAHLLIKTVTSIDYYRFMIGIAAIATFIYFLFSNNVVKELSKDSQ